MRSMVQPARQTGSPEGLRYGQPGAALKGLRYHPAALKGCATIAPGSPEGLRYDDPGYGPRYRRAGNSANSDSV